MEFVHHASLHNKMHEFRMFFLALLFTFGIFQRSMQCMTMSFGTHSSYIYGNRNQCTWHTPFMLESVQFLLHSICHRVTINTWVHRHFIGTFGCIRNRLHEKFGEKPKKNWRKSHSLSNSTQWATIFYSFSFISHFRRMWVIFLF